MGVGGPRSRRAAGRGRAVREAQDPVLRSDRHRADRRRTAGGSFVSTVSSATPDLVIVGAGPAGASAALGALSADPSLRVVMLDRSEFPRDKSCGDGIAPHVIDLLESVGVHGLLDDWTPVQRLQISRADHTVEGQMARATWVVPRTVFDARLVEAAQKAGAALVQQRVRSVDQADDRVTVDA